MSAELQHFPPFPPCRMSFEEYLAFVSSAKLKHEFYHGVVYGMAGGTKAHSALAIAIATQLSLRFLPKGCDVFGSDMLVKNPAQTAAFFPDASVVCGPRDTSQDQSTAISNPCIVVEVLSKSTRNYDQGDKLLEYRKIPTLQYYILIDSQALHLQLHAREANGSWRLTEILEREANLELPVYEVSIPVSEIYGRLTFDPSEPA
jgi:Uma2 family endonuclease